MMKVDYDTFYLGGGPSQFEKRIHFLMIALILAVISVIGLKHSEYFGVAIIDLFVIYILAVNWKSKPTHLVYLVKNKLKYRTKKELIDLDHEDILEITSAYKMSGKYFLFEIKLRKPYPEVGFELRFREGKGFRFFPKSLAEEKLKELGFKVNVG